MELIEESNDARHRLPNLVLPVLMFTGEPGWKGRGACSAPDNDVQFFDGRQETAAKALCSGCPVREQCLEFAVHNDITHGIWGGTTPSERRRL